jgi:cation transport protein ChaC
MPDRKSAMALTAELVAKVHRVTPDHGPLPDRVPMTDADYEELAQRLLDELSGGPVWLFAAGSLIWKPEFAFVERRPATLPGWHRAYCFRITRWRGTPDLPGLMMGIDRGGTCKGVAFRLPPQDPHGQLDRLLRREISYKPAANEPGWHWVRSGEERFRALAFTACRTNPSYDHKIPEGEIVRTLARAAGHWGSCAEYLFNTVRHLDEFGIRDRNLWRLQKLVAEEISRI